VKKIKFSSTITIGCNIIVGASCSKCLLIIRLITISGHSQLNNNACFFLSLTSNYTYSWAVAYNYNQLTTVYCAYGHAARHYICGEKKYWSLDIDKHKQAVKHTVRLDDSFQSKTTADRPSSRTFAYYIVWSCVMFCKLFHILYPVSMFLSG